MTIEAQFNAIAREYDGKRRMFIPCFDDYYQQTTDLLLSGDEQPRQVLDLGAGTGLLTSFWYQKCSHAMYTLVDIAEEMLEISKKRFSGISHIRHLICDYTKQLPEGNYDAVISALSIHHLEDAQKETLFRRIYERLPKGGLLVNYDQFCAGSEKLNECFDRRWEQQLAASGLTERDIALWKERRKLDRECSVETEIAMLRRCRYTEVACLYSYHKFSVIAAVK